MASIMQQRGNNSIGDELHLLPARTGSNVHIASDSDDENDIMENDPARLQRFRERASTFAVWTQHLIRKPNCPSSTVFFTTIVKYISVMIYIQLIVQSIMRDDFTIRPFRYVHLFELLLGGSLLWTNGIITYLGCGKYNVSVHRQILPVAEALLLTYALTVGLSIGISLTRLDNDKLYDTSIEYILVVVLMLYFLSLTIPDKITKKYKLLFLCFPRGTEPLTPLALVHLVIHAVNTILLMVSFKNCVGSSSRFCSLLSFTAFVCALYLLWSAATFSETNWNNAFNIALSQLLFIICIIHTKSHEQD